MRPSEQSRLGVIHTAHRVVVKDHAADTAIFGKSARLLRDLLRRKDTGHVAQEGVAPQQRQVARQLFDAIDAGA